MLELFSTVFNTAWKEMLEKNAISYTVACQTRTLGVSVLDAGCKEVHGLKFKKIKTIIKPVKVCFLLLS